MSDNDPLAGPLRELTNRFKANESTLIDEIIKETNRRNSLDAIIEETERRIKAEQAQRQTSSRRSLIRSLKARLKTAQAAASKIVTRIQSLGSQVKNLRLNFRTSVASLLKGGALGIGVDVALNILNNALESAIAKEIEDRKDDENDRRCIQNSLKSMTGCFARGSRNQDRKKSGWKVEGKEANTHDFIGEMMSATKSYYDGLIDVPSNRNYGYPKFAKAWLELMHQFYDELEKIVDESIVTKDLTETVDYRWITVDGEVSVCEKKKAGEQIPDL